MLKEIRIPYGWLCAAVFGVMLIATGPLRAADNDAQSEQSAGTGVTQAVQPEADELEGISNDRENLVKELAEEWAAQSNETVDVLVQAFNALSAEQLLAIQEASNFDEVRLIVLGESADESADPATPLDATVVPLALGELDRDFVFTPVVPCRIVDTRSAGGVIPAGGTRNFAVHGSGALLAGQGGNPAGCPSPRGEPRAVHINVTVVPVGGNGNIQVFPFSTPPPTSSLVNFKLGTNIANAATIKTGFLLGPDITVRANFSAAHVIIDVLGYYHEVEKITKYLSIPARGGFVPHEDDGSFGSCFPNTFAWSGAGDSRFYAMVYLPQGAVVTRLTYHFWRGGSATSETRADLFRQPVPATSSRTAMATVVSTSSDSGHTSRSDSSISNATIDNQNFTYYVEVDLPHAGQMCTDGVVIRYTDVE